MEKQLETIIQGLGLRGYYWDKQRINGYSSARMGLGRRNHILRNSRVPQSSLPLRPPSPSAGTFGKLTLHIPYRPNPAPILGTWKTGRPKLGAHGMDGDGGSCQLASI